MSISKRIMRLVKSDIHEILDCLEDPRSILAQAIRDMEEEVGLTRSGLESTEQEIRRTDSTIGRIDEHLQDVHGQIDLCFDNANDRLARTFVRKRLELEAAREQLERSKAAREKNREQFASRLKEQEEKLGSIKEKQAIFSEHERRRDTAEALDEKQFISDERIEVAMLEEYQKRNRMAQ